MVRAGFVLKAQGRPAAFLKKGCGTLALRFSPINEKVLGVLPQFEIWTWELNGHPFRCHRVQFSQHAFLEVHLFGGEAGGVWVVGDEHDGFVQLVIQG